VSDWDPPDPSLGVKGKLSMQSVEELHARGRHLIDSRPPDEYPVAWCSEASHVGDLSALAMLAALAARSAQKPS
jgi:hypothetical protein